MVDGAHVVERELHRVVLAYAKQTHNLEIAHAGLDGVMAGAHSLESHGFDYGVEGLFAAQDVVGAQTV